MNTNNVINTNDKAFGTFIVTTDHWNGIGYEHLGTFTGYIDEIAFYLADKCRGALAFKPVYAEDLTGVKPTRDDTVTIVLDDEKRDWKTINDVFESRNVEVEVEKDYPLGCKCTITRKKTKEERIQAALNKLTDEEKELLGLNN